MNIEGIGLSLRANTLMNQDFLYIKLSEIEKMGVSLL